MRSNYYAVKNKIAMEAKDKPSATRDPVPTDWTTINLILEDVIVTFLITLIPELIVLGRPPLSFEEVYVPILSSVLMSIYSYMRMRGIERAESEDE
ncbi:MAG: hypothetical protein ACTSPB_02405 [Candidatus Thorarchaeota archaeon]